MTSQLRACVVVFVSLTLLTGVVYPVAVTVLAQSMAPQQANGSLIERNGTLVGSSLIGQSFTDVRYFWGRPSATTPFPNNAASSSGSNLGPTNPDQLKTVGDRVAALQAAHPDQTGPIPVDLITASASGLDPHISPAAASYQVTRVAHARGLSPGDVQHVVERFTEPRTWGLLGEPRVNVLALNLALDAEPKR